MSVVELEEQLACMDREVEEKHDVLKNTVWGMFDSMGQSINLSGDSLQSLLYITEMNEKLKVKQLIDEHLEPDVDKLWMMDYAGCIERYEKWKDLQETNKKQLEDLHKEMHYRECISQLDQLRTKIKDYRAGNNRSQNKLAMINQDFKAAKTKKTAVKVNCSNVLEELRIAISEVNRSLSTDPVLIDDEDSSYLIWPTPNL